MVLGSTHHKIMPWPLGGSKEMPIDFEYCLKNLIRWLYPGINEMAKDFWFWSGQGFKNQVRLSLTVPGEETQ